MGVIIALGVVFVVLLLCRVLSILFSKTNDLVCPSCGGKLEYRIRDEQNNDDLHYVDYWCENCGWSITLPPDINESNN